MQRGDLLPRAEASRGATVTGEILLGLVVVLAACASAGGQSNDVAEEVSMDHALHAGEYGIGCLYCHPHADKSTVAGLPSIQRCMGCHKFVAKEQPAIQELARRFQGGGAVSWARVYDLPDHVYFSHRVHVRAHMACAECHGAVERMARVARASSLEMGACLDCHRRRGASVDCLACHK